MSVCIFYEILNKKKKIIFFQPTSQQQIYIKLNIFEKTENREEWQAKNKVNVALAKVSI
jgi:hypothetical protein